MKMRLSRLFVFVTFTLPSFAQVGFPGFLDPSQLFLRRTKVNTYTCTCPPNPPRYYNQPRVTVEQYDSDGNLTTTVVERWDKPVSCSQYTGPYPNPPDTQTSQTRLDSCIGGIYGDTYTLDMPAPPVTCPPVAVSVQAFGSVIFADFKPGSGLTLNAAANACGFKRFNWRQFVTNLPSPSPFYTRQSPFTELTAPPAFNDPPDGGGYDGRAPDYSFPYYYDITGELSNHETVDTLSFSDRPEDVCLPTGPLTSYRKGVIALKCWGATAPKGSYMAFKTELVGVLQDGKPSKALYTWEWKSTFNGTSGGIGLLKNELPADPDSGFGGITITNLNGVAQIPPSVTCNATPETLWPPNGQTMSIKVSGNVIGGTQPVVGATFAVTDEYGKIQPTGAVPVAVSGSYSVGIPLVAARNGDDEDGRAYEIIVSAKDKIGNIGSCSVAVSVPHDQGK